MVTKIAEKTSCRFLLPLDIHEYSRIVVTTKTIPTPG